MLKAHQLIAGRLGEGPIIGGPLTLGSICAAELALAAWLLSGRGARQARPTAAVAFTVMFGVALYAVLGGAASCGCLGSVDVPPANMVAFDALAVLALAMTAGAAPSQPGVGGFRLALPTLLLGTAGSAAVVGWAVALGRWPAQLNASGEITGLGRRVSAEPGDWIGKRLPALGYIDRAEVISHGDWVAVFHHHRCVYCRRAVEQLCALAADVEPSANTPRFAFIEVPPFGEESEKHPPRPTEKLAIDARLTAAYTWALPLPTMVTCGPLALIAVTTKLGIHLSESEKDDILSAAGSHGTDLATLKELTEKQGLHALGVETSVEGLRARGLPAIVFVRGYGFAAVTGYSGSDVEVVYPFAEPIMLADVDFEKEFGTTGRALFVSRKRITSAVSASKDFRAVSGPVLRATRSMLAFGRVYRKSYSATIDLFNDGNSTLQINEVSSSTPRIAATVDATRISPLGKARLSVSGDVNSVGPVAESVILLTNSIEGPVMRLPVRGYVDGPAFLPQPHVLFDGVVEGDPAQLSVPVELSPGVDRDALVCSTRNENYCSASLEDEANGKLSLRIAWHGTAGVGWHRITAEIRQDGPDAVPATLNVAAHVLSELEAEPRSLWIDDASLAAGRWSRQVTMRRRSSSDLKPRFRWSDVRVDRAVKVTVDECGDGTATLLLEPIATDSAKTLHGLRDVLTVLSDDGSTAAINLHFGEPGGRARGENSLR